MHTEYSLARLSPRQTYDKGFVGEERNEVKISRCVLKMSQTVTSLT